MTDAIEEVLAARRSRPAGLGRMVAASFSVHAGAVIIAIVVSHLWLQAERQEPHLLTVNLTAGAEGPRSTGMTPLAGRPVEQVAPPPKRPEPVKPVPLKRDVMTVPDKPKPEPKPAPKAPEPPKPSTPAERPPTTGAEVRTGTSSVETNVKGQGTGLSTGGTFGAAQDVQIDPQFKFCCQSYIDTMCEIIQRNWQKDQHTNGDVILHFTIHRDGSITDIGTDRAYNRNLERFAVSALDDARDMGGFGKLPPEFKGDQLVVHLRFPYVR